MMLKKQAAVPNMESGLADDLPPAIIAFVDENKNNRKGTMKRVQEEREMAIDNVYDIDAPNTCGFTNVDEILDITGANGPFQWLLTASLLFIQLPGVIAVYITYFIASDAQWNCATNSSTCRWNRTQGEIDSYMCKLDPQDWYFIEDTKTSIQSYYNLHCGKEWLLHTARSSLFVGWALSSFFGSCLPDRYGRKKTLYLLFTLFLLFGSISAFSPNIESFILFRFLAGVALPGPSQLVYIVVGEFTNNKYRSLLINILMIGHAVGLVFLSILAYFVRNWSLLVMLTTLPFLVLLQSYKFAPESLYWLKLNRKQEELVAVVKRMCHWNRTQLPEIIQINSLEGNGLKPRSGVRDLFKTRGLCAQTCVVLYGWFVVGVVYYGVAIAADDLTGAFYRDFAILRTVEIPSCLLGIYFSNRFGRKKTTCLNLLIASTACILIACTPSTGDVKMFRLVLGVLGTFCITMAFNVYISWTIELYGTDLRATAVGASNLASKMGGAVAPWVVKGLKSFHLSAPFYLEGGLGLLCVMLMWLLPETKDTPMRNISKVGHVQSCVNRWSANDVERAKSKTIGVANGDKIPDPVSQ